MIKMVMEISMIDFTSIESIRHSGFEGFVSVAELCRSGVEAIPRWPGVYLVLWPTEEVPKFLEESPAGHFKGKNPSVSKAELEANWVPDSKVIYIGKAGGSGSSHLRRRIKQYVDFGQGKPVGHYGGRYIWQIDQSDELLICWKIVEDENPQDVERGAIDAFADDFGELPFANLVR